MIERNRTIEEQIEINAKAIEENRKKRGEGI